MISKLLLATSAIGALSAPVANYQHTTQEGNINITYQYETNEVNSPDDLVVGNVYHFQITEGAKPSDIFPTDNSIRFLLVNGSITLKTLVYVYVDEFFTPVTIDALSEIVIQSDNYLFSYSHDFEGESYLSVSYENIVFETSTFDFVYLDGYLVDSSSISNYISASDYNVITNVEEVYHTGLFGNLADFLRYHIYGGIPHVTDIQFEIANQTITMLDWLVTTTTIALAVLSLVLLFYFFRWVFKLVSGLIILR